MEKAMATHFSTLAWRIPEMGEPGGLLSMGLHRVGHDWSDLAVVAMIRDVEHLFMYLLPIYMSSLEKCLFISPAYFIIRFIIFANSCLRSLYILDISPLSDIWLANIFSLSVDCFFHFVNGFLYCAEAFCFVVVPFVCFCFCFLWFWC